MVANTWAKDIHAKDMSFARSSNYEIAALPGNFSVFGTYGKRKKKEKKRARSAQKKRAQRAQRAGAAGATVGAHRRLPLRSQRWSFRMEYALGGPAHADIGSRASVFALKLEISRVMDLEQRS